VRRSYDTLDIHPHPRLKEPPLCRPQPSGRYHQTSKPRCARYSAVPGMALCWRSIDSCGVLRAVTRRRCRPCCCARTPGCTAYHTRVSHGEPRRTDRPRRSALRGRPGAPRDALAPTLPGRLTHSRPAGLWLVPDPLALCDAGRHTADHTGPGGVGGHRATLAPRDGLGVETGQAGGLGDSLFFSVGESWYQIGEVKQIFEGY
jgi:hypothetical protein